MNTIPQTCRFDGCSNIDEYKQYKNGGRYAFRAGYCRHHYDKYRLKLRKYSMDESYKPRPAIIEGDIAKIPLGINAKDGYAIVDADMAWLADNYKFNISSGTGYAAPTHDKAIKLHNMIVGKAQKGFTVDHINRDRLDNRRSNLRVVTKAQNIVNSKPRSSSGYKGVSKTSGGWRAYYKPYGSGQIHIGCYKTPEEAAKAYDKVAKETWGEFAYLNFPEA